MQKRREFPIRKLAGLTRRAAAVLGLQPTCPAVLMYHRIADASSDPWGLAVSPVRFAAHLDVLRRERDVLTLSEFAALLAQRRLPARATAITFDDGYACNACVAAPLLQSRQLPATFFLATGAIGGTREFWWDELTRLVVETCAPARANIAIGATSFMVDFSLPPVPPAMLKVWHWADMQVLPRLRLYMILWTVMRTLPHDRQLEVLDALWRACGEAAQPRPTHRVMTVAEARGLAACELFRIAPHSVTHPPLGLLPEAVQREEINRSLLDCRALSPLAAPLFAYPYGDFTPVTARLVREAGLVLACTTQPRAVAPGCDVTMVPRLQVLDRSANWLTQAIGRLGPLFS